MKLFWSIAFALFFAACGGSEPPTTATEASSLRQCGTHCTTSVLCTAPCQDGDGPPTTCGGAWLPCSQCLNNCHCPRPSVCYSNGTCGADFGPLPQCRGDCDCTFGQHCVSGFCN